MKGIHDRSVLLLGRDNMNVLGNLKVILFGVGGVGSWCAESLVRTGIVHLTIVDSDCVSVSNVNRQLMATCSSVGRVKVEAMKERLLDINPDADINAVRAAYDAESAPSFHLSDYDVIIDCIDSLKNKIDLIVEASHVPGARVYSSMGAALKVDPCRIKVAEYWSVRGCPLAAAMRKRMHQRKLALGSKVMCVYSDEVLLNKGAADLQEVNCASAWDDKKARINGSLQHITGIFGFTLAGLVIKDAVSVEAAC